MLIIEKKLSEVFTTNLKKLLGYQDFFILRKATELGKSGNSIRVSITHLPQKPIKSPRDKIIKKADEIKENLIENLAYIFDFDYSVTGYFSPIRISFVIFFKKLKIKQEKDSELYSKFKESLETIFKKDSEKRIDFNQGLDIRLITPENAKLLHEIKRWKGLRLRFAFDDPSLKKIIQSKLKILNNAGISNGSIQFYVLIGFNTSHNENLRRILLLKNKGIDAFVMPFNKMDPYQKSFARWVNRHFYKYQSWEEYISNKPLLAEV